MISVNNLTVDFGKQLLFNDISFVVGDKERVALVGKNGAGKTTLLKILAGLERPTNGTVSTNKGLSIGYLPQVMNFCDQKSLWQEVETVFAKQKEEERQLETLVTQLDLTKDKDSPEYFQLLEEYTERSERLQLQMPHAYEAYMEQILLGLGFERNDFSRPTREFSGGWRMRIELAKILLSKPDLLLLDEPTNHLDIDSIQWLEGYLRSSARALILVSHDRAFLDAVTERTLEIMLGDLYDYRVSYSDFIALRKERIESQQRAFENQQKKIADTEAFIERFRYKATKAVQVQSRIKQLEKLDRIKVEDLDRKKIHFRFPAASRSGDFPLIVEDLAKNYGEKRVFSRVSFTLRRGEKVAFLGKNGSGKTTLIRCIMGEIEDFEGRLQLGHNVSISYFSQNQAQELDNKLTIREIVDRNANGDIRLQIDNLLGAFMFGGEIADKPIAVLSGGERSRLAVLLLLLHPGNFLVLDEPTNHLDIRSKEVLKEAVKAFTGTVILVSHDRYFLEGLVDKVYDFDRGVVTEHLGGVQEYLERQNEKRQQANETDVGSLKKRGDQPVQSDARLQYERRKENQKRLKALKNSLKQKEDLVAQLESDLSRVEEQIASGCVDLTSEDIYTRHQQINRQLEEAMNDWGTLAEKLQEIEQDGTSA